MKAIICCLLFFFFARIGSAQTIVFNTIDSIYYLNQGTLCGFSWAGAYCGQGTTGVFSTALYKDTLYILTVNSSLYKMTLNDPATCTFLTTFPSNDRWGMGRATINSMTVDKYGIIYGADLETTDLLRYNPYTNARQIIGRVGSYPAGDMLFYKNKLLLATILNGIVEVNISNPASSTQYMSTAGNIFYGLIAVPFNCYNNKYYGLKILPGDSTAFVELDLENKVVGAIACKVSKTAYDAASNVDDGNTIGVTIDTILVKAPCNNETVVQQIQVVASSASNGQLTYVLNGNITNSTGIFTNIPEGSHHIKITNSKNCVKDSTFTVLHGLSNITINTVNPFSCDQENGNITVNATSGYLPIMYKLGSGNFQANSSFANLPAGVHTIRIRDAGGCEKDTTVHLRYQATPTYFSSFTARPTVCNGKTGNITINLPASTNPGDVTSSLNNGTPQSNLVYQNLDGGNYNLTVYFQNSCRYDTLIRIDRLTNERPQINLAVSDQQCLLDNGALNVSIAGTHGPFQLSFNNGTFTGNTTYSNLAWGNYSLIIQDKDLCRFDTTVEIKPYPVLSYTLDTTKINPICTAPRSGVITVNIVGNQPPYRFVYNNNQYSSGSSIANLSEGVYSISIRNNDNCELQKINIDLSLELTPECDFVFVPTAFTPNEDGLNETIAPYIGEGVIDFKFDIFNVWGQHVFSTTMRNKGWDGKIAGQLQPSGVFVWMLTYRTVNNLTRRLLKGTFILIR